jgi:hypothetical protein
VKDEIRRPRPLSSKNRDAAHQQRHTEAQRHRESR